jgi:hypothetical protein
VRETSRAIHSCGVTRRRRAGKRETEKRKPADPSLCRRFEPWNGRAPPREILPTATERDTDTDSDNDSAQAKHTQQGGEAAAQQAQSEQCVDESGRQHWQQ